MNNCEKLKELLEDKSKTQLMRQQINLYGLKYIKTGGLMLLHSYYEKKDGKSVNPLFSAPATLVDINRSNGLPELTIRTLKDGLDPYGISLVKSMHEYEIEVAYSDLAQEILSPKIEKEGWDNWVFSYSVPDSQKLELRKARTRATSARLYRGLKSIDFENKKILFLGSGDGDEIEALINYFNIKSAQIWGIEQSKTACLASLELSSKFPGIKFSMNQLDMKDLDKLEQKDFDIIIAVGFFDRETLREADGKMFLQSILQMLSFRYLATKAYNFELFSSSCYEQSGLKVIASSVPQSMYTKDYSFFYLLEKP